MTPGDRVTYPDAHGEMLDCELVAGPDARGLVLVRHWDTRELLRCCWLVPAARVRLAADQSRTAAIP